jgi:carboxyl-terminal processing protease
MESNSVNRNKIDWADFRAKVLEKTEAAQTIPQAYIGLKEALILLDDNHSYFKKPDGNYFSGYFGNCSAETVFMPSLPDNVGYVRVNMFSGVANSNEAVAFASEIQNQISTADHSNITGWIVDLRGNAGGNMWPMVAGIGPLLGEGTFGYFIDPENNQTAWGYSNGSSTINGNVQTKLISFYEIINPDPKVAVLLDNAVASSGESVAIAFIGRADTKIFGSSTCGQTTAIQGFNLSDGALLGLATAYVADRNKNQYDAPINADVIIDNQSIIQHALEWIEN